MDKRDQLLAEFLKLVEKYSVTAYEINNATGISAVGIQKIINGETKRPLERTLETITSYIKENYIAPVENKENDPIKNKPHDEQMEILFNEVIDVEKKIDLNTAALIARQDIQDRDVVILKNKIEQQNKTLLEIKDMLQMVLKNI